MDENTKISLKNALWLVGVVIAAFLGWRQMEKAHEDRQAALESRVAAIETLNAAKATNDNEMRDMVKQNNAMLLRLMEKGLK